MSLSSRTVVAGFVAAVIFTGLILFGIFYLRAPEGAPMAGGPDAPLGGSADAPEGQNPNGDAGTTTPVDSEAAAKANDATPLVAETSAEERRGPLSLSGRVLHGSEGVRGAFVTAFDASRWRETVEEASAKLQRGPPDFSALRSMLRESYQGRVERVARVRSDGDGAFAFHALPRGEYQLWVAHPEYLPSNDSWAIVADGEPATVDIYMNVASRIRGRVVAAADSKPIAGVAIRSTPDYLHASSGIGSFIQAIFAEMDGAGMRADHAVTTNADGRFEIRSLEPVPQTLTLSRNGFSQAVYPKVVPGEEETTLTLFRGSALSGRLVDATGAPVNGVVWTLTPKLEAEENNPMAFAQQEFDVFGEKVQTGRTAESGKLEAFGLDPQTYVLRAEAKGLPTLEVDVEPEGESVDLGDIAFEKAQTLSGTVRNEDGDAIADARVWLERRVQSNPFDRDKRVELETRTDSDGTYSIGPVPSDLRVRASAEGYVQADGKKPDFTLESFDFELAEGLAIMARVVDDSTDEPLEGVQATAYTGSAPNNVTTEADGIVELTGIPKNHQRAYVNFKRSGYNNHGAQLPATAPSELDDDSPKEVRLTPHRRVSGVVLDPEGKPVRHARIRFEIPGMPAFLLLMEGGGAPQPALSRTDGTFSTHAPSGRTGPGRGGLELVATHPEYAPTHLSVQDLLESEDDPIEVEIVLSPGTRLEGTVTGADGEAIAGAQVRLNRSIQLEGEARMFAMMAGPQAGTVVYAAKDGSYRFPGLEPGEYTLNAYALGLAPASLSMQIAAEEVTRRDIALREGESISGRIVDADGEVIPDAEIVLFTDAEDLKDGPGFDDEMFLLGARGTNSARSDADGRFRLKNLEDTEYALVVRHRRSPPLVQTSVRPGRLGDLVLEGFGTLSIQVVSDESGELVTNYRVNVRQKEQKGLRIRWREPERVRSRDGRYQRDDLPAGTYRVGIVADGFAPYVGEVNVRGGRPRDEIIRLVTGHALKVVVVDAEGGKPIAGASVHVGTIYEKSEERQRSERNRLGELGLQEGLQTDGDGVVAVNSLEEGKFHVNANHPDYYYDGNTKDSTVEMPGATGHELRLVLKRAGQLHGKVRGIAREQGVYRMLVFARHEASGETQEKRSVWIDQSSGDYRATSLRPGTYRVSMTTQFHGKKPSEAAPQEVLLSDSVTVEAGDVETLNLNVSN